MQVARADSTTITIIRDTSAASVVAAAAAAPAPAAVARSPPPPPTAALAAAAAAPTRASGGRKGGAKGRKMWKLEHLDALISVMEASAPPMGSDGWARVTRAFNAATAASGIHRTEEQLQRRFRALHESKGQTGDPALRPHIERAKRLRERMDAAVHIRQSNSLFDDDEHDDDDAGDPPSLPNAFGDEPIDAAPSFDAPPFLSSDSAAAAASPQSFASSTSSTPTRASRARITPSVNDLLRDSVALEAQRAAREEARSVKLDTALTAMANAVTALATALSAQHAQHHPPLP